MGRHGVLKAGHQADRWPRRRITARDWMAAERAEELIAGAEAEAEAVRRSAGEVRAAALEEGRAEGLRTAAVEVRERLATLEEAQRRWLARAEIEALDLAVEMARRLVGRELRCDPTAVAGGAVEALRAAGRRRALRVRLNPESLADLRLHPAALDEASAGAELQLLADPTLVPGDVVVETEAGQVDARIASRLERFRVALLDGAAP
jgi:flagellar assembly protein FliH